MKFHKILKNRVIKNLILKIDSKRSGEIIRKIKPYLKRNEKIIDIGSGLCIICKKLGDLGYNVSPLDIKNLSLFEDITPVVYDGEKIPYPDDYFDLSLLITVFHHTKNPKSVLKEARRLSKKLIVVEDIYKSSFQKYLTFTMDSLVNLEFFNHPRKNKTDQEWRKLFKNLDLKVKQISFCNYWRFFTSVTYFLEKR